MKELSIEEKAKAYDEALENAKYYHSEMGDDVKCVLEEVFPVLNESEDERIRQTLIRFHKSTIDVDGIKGADIIAWLEKQHRQKDSVVDFKTKDWYVSKVDGKIHNICYSVDMVEPRFKIGDWVVFNNKFHDSIYQIENIENYVYTLRHFLGGSMPLAFGKEDMIRHWNIQDAKNGDVLKEDSCTFIIERMKSDGVAIIHCCLFDDGDFDLGSTLSFDVDSTYPATKEQRDALMEAMANAGYTFDFDKKELKKIHVIDEGKAEMDYCFTKMMNGEKVSSAWSEDDERNIKELLYLVEANYLTSEEPHDRLINFLESLKERVQPQSKQECGEENSIRLQRIIDFLWYNRKGDTDTIYQQEQDIEWLKSLRPQNRWKPSDVQMELLKEACDKRWEPDGLDPLYVLYQNLKKLKEE